MKRNIFFILLVSLLTWHSCKKDPPPQDDQQTYLGYNYYPQQVGSYVIYEVDSIAFDDKSHPPDTTRYILKELVESVFTDNSGRPTLRLERYYKMYNDTIPYDSLPWIGPRIWYANVTNTTLERTEENLRYIRLVFPPKKGKEWDGNAFNTFDAKDYEVLSADQPEVVNGISFDSVVTVLQYEQIDFIEYIYEAEKYAANVGLVYKQRDSIYDGGGPDSIGYLFTQKVISYGK